MHWRTVITLIDRGPFEVLPHEADLLDTLLKWPGQDLAERYKQPLAHLAWKYLPQCRLAKQPMAKRSGA